MMFGIDVHSPYFFVQLCSFLIVVFWVVVDTLDALRRNTLEKHDLIGNMTRNWLEHRSLRSTIRLHIAIGDKIPWSMLALLTDLTGLKQHFHNNNFYFYFGDGGFITVVPITHVQINQ